MQLENKAIISLEEYQELKDFKENILKGKICCLINQDYSSSSIICFHTEHEIIERLTTSLNETIESRNKLANDIDIAKKNEHVYEARIKRLESAIETLTQPKSFWVRLKNLFTNG